IVLLAAQGRSTRSIAAELDTWPGRVSRWRTRFARHRLAGLHDLPRPGPAPRYTADTGKRILALLDQPPPSGYGRWTAPLLSRELGDVSDQYIWRFLRAHKINLAARKSWCESDDPDFVAKAAEIVGLYLDPPQDAIVLAVDQKPHTQALERAQGYLKLPNVRFHFTPTYSSWLNQIEIWFSILQGNSLAGTSFISVQQLRDHIDAFVDSYNTRAIPFVWTKDVVHQKRLKSRFSDL